MTVSANAGCTATDITLGSPITSDNCSVASVVSNAPAVYPLGTNVVTWTVTDGSGNTATCTQRVIVRDTTAPTITPPPDVTVSANAAGCTATNVALGSPVTGDNCSVASVVSNAPAAYPLGTNFVTWTVTDGSGNTATGVQTVTVNPVATVSVNSATICAGGSATLTATTGASSPSYLWSPGGATTASITVSPTATTTYTVTVTDGTTGCANSGSGTVTVNPAPTLTTDTTNETGCAGSAVTWSVEATGTGLSYQWQRDGTNLVEGVENFTGTTSTTLTNSAVTAADGVDGTHGYACVISIGTCSVTSTMGSLTVNPLPTASVNSATICAGGSATLTASSDASSPSYVWNDPVNSTTASITVSPTATTTYTVTVTDGTTGCANSGGGTVMVNPLPAASVNSVTICAGGSATLTASSDASSPSYLWNDPANSTTASITVSPAATATYTVTVTDGVTGCANSGSGTVTVNPLPAASVNSATICAGGSATLTASSDASSPSYLWNDPANSTTASITVSPAATATYTVTVTDGVTGCANSGSGTVTVNPVPTAAAGSDQTVCAGSAVGIGGSPTANGGTAPYTYSWTPATGLDDAMAANPTATVTHTTTYTVTVIDQNGCTASDSVVLTLVPQPEITASTRSGTDLTLAWTALAGQTYRVQYNTLSGGGWTNVPGDVLAERWDGD